MSNVRAWGFSRVERMGLPISTTSELPSGEGVYGVWSGVRSEGWPYSHVCAK